MGMELLCRSVLITPAIKPDRFFNGAEAGGDVTIIDFEDSIPPELKEDARRIGAEFLAGTKNRGAVFGVRPNKIDLEDGIKDIVALLDRGAKPAVIMIPKVESASEVHIIDNLLAKKIDQIQYYATIETAKGLINVFEIAAASPRLTGLIFGSADLSQDIGSTMGWESMFYGRSRVIIAAANARIDAIDTPSFNFDDPEGLNVESRRVKDMGYIGKIVVHTNQIEIVNRAFTPGKDEIEWARMILEARKNSGIGNICVVNGKMVGPPMYNSARRTLEIARRTGLLN